jgi:hypothetical protein
MLQSSYFTIFFKITVSSSQNVHSFSCQAVNLQDIDVLTDQIFCCYLFYEQQEINATQHFVVITPFSFNLGQCKIDTLWLENYI